MSDSIMLDAFLLLTRMPSIHVRGVCLQVRTLLEELVIESQVDMMSLQVHD